MRVVALLWFSTAVGRSVGSASARSEIVPVAIPHGRTVASRGRRFAARVSGRLRRQRTRRSAHPARGRCLVVVLYSSLTGSVGSASARSEIVPVAVESLARPAAYRWVRGPSGPLSGRHRRRVSAVRTPRSPLRGACFWPPSAAADQKVRAPSARSLPCCGSLQQFDRFGGERIGPQRDRAGGSREPRQAGGVSLGARAFWPAFRKTQPARQRRPHPTVVPSHPACFWPPSAAADQKVRAPSARSLPCCGSLQHLGRSVGSASARSEIVPVAVESIARPAAYRWVRGPSGPLSGRHSRRVSAVHTPRSYRRTPRVSGRLRRQRARRSAHPARGRCLVVVLYSTLAGRWGAHRPAAR